MPTADPSWSIAGAGDFNGDGDIPWRHTSGTVYVWLTTETAIASGASLPTADPSWSIAAVSDFNRDEKSSGATPAAPSTRG